MQQRFLLSMITGLVVVAAGRAMAVEPAARPVSFQKQVAPVLARHCQGCHQPASRGGKLAVTSYALLKEGGAAGPAFVPGEPDKSPLVRLISGPEPKMPKGGTPLPSATVALIRRWVAEGAKDDTVAAKALYTAEHPPVYTAAPVITTLAYSPDGKTLAVSGYHEVLLHHADGSGLVGRLIGPSDRIESVAYSPDGKLLAAVGGVPARSGEIQFWDTSTNRLVHSVTLSYDTFFGASFSPDGKLLAVGGADQTARVVSVPDGKEIAKLDSHTNWVFGTAFSKDGKHFVSASRDQAVKLTEVATGSFVDDINRHLSAVRCLARHPKEDQVLYGGDDGIPRLYTMFRTHVRTMNQEDYNLVRAFEKQPGPVNAVGISPDGELAAIGVGDEVRLYKIADGSKVTTLRGAKGPVFAIAFHPEGKQVAIGGLDGQARLYELPSGRLAKAFSPVPLAKQVAGAK
jgi:WD40 repeat protein